MARVQFAKYPGNFTTPRAKMVHCATMMQLYVCNNTYNISIKQILNLRFNEQNTCRSKQKSHC